MHMRVYYLDCHEAGLCCYLVNHSDYIYYSSFTSICDLFTDSSSYYVYEKAIRNTVSVLS
jgi:hypothetical protein